MSKNANIRFLKEFEKGCRKISFLDVSLSVGKPRVLAKFHQIKIKQLKF